MPATHPAQQLAVPPGNVPVNVNVPPPGIAPAGIPPPTLLDHVGAGLWRNAVDQDVTNLVVLAIERKIAVLAI